MTTKNLSYDFNDAFSHFFKQEDWKKRSLWIIEFYGLINLLYILSNFIMIIPFIGLICLPVMCLTIPLFFVAGFWFTGYIIEVAKLVSTHKHYEIKPLNEKFKERVIDGLKVCIGSLVYALPMIITTIISIVLFIISVNMMDANPDNNAVIVVGVVLIILAMLGLLLTTVLYLAFFIIYPAVVRQYIKSGSINSMLDFGEVYSYTKNNFVNLLIVGGILLVLSFVLSFATWFAQMSIFLCIGIVIIPIVSGVGTLYVMDIYAVLLGQMMKMEK